MEGARFMVSKRLQLTLVLLSLLSASGSAQMMGRIRWAPDGLHLQKGRHWFDPATLKEVEAVDQAPLRDSSRALRAEFEGALNEATGRRVPASVLRGREPMSTLPRAKLRYPGARTSADGKSASVVIDGALWTWRASGKAKKIASGLEGIRHFEAAPDGSALSWIKDNDLYLTRTEDGTVFRLTQDGGDSLFNGELDWVYQEEVYGRYVFKGTWWSPSSDQLAWIRIDEEGVDTFLVVDHIPNKLKVERIRYPKAGSVNPRASLRVSRPSDGRTTAIDLSKYRPEDEILIVRVGWVPEGDRVFFMVQNREQTWLDLNLGNPESGAVETLIHEECQDGWVNVLSLPRFLKDGSFLWESERSGFKHLYRYDRTGKLLATVTSGERELRSIIKLDEERGQVSYYTSGEAVGRQAFVSTLDGKRTDPLSEGLGYHTVSLSKDGRYAIDRFDSLSNPGEQWLRTVGKKKAIQTWKANARKSAGRAGFFQVKARDGEILDVTVKKPRNFDAKKSYPVWIDTYSGPDIPSVRNRWGAGGDRGGWFSRRGIILMQVNVRSASGRGMRYTKTCYRQFGVQELKDLEDAVSWLTKKPWADAGRVGISGWSYGGFMTAFALTHSKMFKCGIAGAGVYDWRLYDTIYTERYMAKPQNNPEGYAKSSVVEAAGNLHGQLLIVHGTMDDNVHMQNSIQFIHALQQANKQNFEFMIYPKSRHGVGSRHLSTLRRRFIEKNL